MSRNTQRASTLLASITEDMLGGSFDQPLVDNTLRVERLLLEMVRPDPVQPRRVLPERIHFAFHEHRLTPAQALRELVQIAQVAARQRGRPFSDVLELLPSVDAEGEEDVEVPLSPEEKLLRDLVNLAVTIRDDGQVNPLSVVDISQGVTRLYRIETGERRYWATWLLHDFIADGGNDGTIPCIAIAANRASVFRQAKENTARSGLSAIAMARQAALLLLAAHGYEIPNSPVSNDFYRQALELDLRGKREFTHAILSAMGGISKVRFSQYKALLQLSDEAIETADRYSLDEWRLRFVLSLAPEDHLEMVQQIIQFNLSAKQIKELCEAGQQEGGDESSNKPLPHIARIAKLIHKPQAANPHGIALEIVRQEKSIHLALARVREFRDLLEEVESALHSQEIG